MSEGSATSCKTARPGGCAVLGTLKGSLACSIEVIAEPEASRRMAEVGRLRVAERFSYERLLAEHQSLYEELLG